MNPADPEWDSDLTDLAAALFGREPTTDDDGEPDPKAVNVVPNEGTNPVGVAHDDALELVRHLFS